MGRALGFILCSRTPCRVGWAVLLFLSLNACSMRNRTARPEPPALVAPGTVSWKPHVGEVFVFEFPEGWAIQTPAGQEAEIHRVRLHSDFGFDGQLTLLRDAPKPGTFPTRVLEKMQDEEPALKAEAFSIRLAGMPASGYRFSFSKAGLPWTGWVVSCTRGRSELCALGRWPTNATELRAHWSVIVRNLRVKADGFPAVIAPNPKPKEDAGDP